MCFEYMFAHVEAGQTPEERVAVINVTTCQGIGYQDYLICHILSNQPEIMHLNASLTNIVDMSISKREVSIKPETKVLYNCWVHKITEYPEREEEIYVCEFSMR